MRGNPNRTVTSASYQWDGTGSCPYEQQNKSKGYKGGWLTVAALLLTVAGFALTGPADAAPRPNIIVIMTDDQDRSPPAVMPLTRYHLAQKGVTFSNAFAQFPQCSPSRASLLTGRAAHNHGIIGNQPEDGGYEGFTAYEPDCLPVWLQSAGYRTVLFGKYMNGFNRVRTPDYIPPGWSEWFGIYVARYYDYHMNENGTVVRYRQAPEDYSTDVIRAKAVDFINRQASSTEPFFMLVAPNAPHSIGAEGSAIPAPRHEGVYDNLYQPPYGGAFNEADVTDKPSHIAELPRYTAEEKAEVTAKYRAARASLLAVDEMVEAIVAATRTTPHLRNTVIVFTSDNGMSFGAQRVTDKGVVYEPSVGVPLVIRGPGVAMAETRSQLVSNLDITATILDLAQAAAPHPLDGKSLAPLFAGDAPWRSALLLQGRANSSGGLVRYFAVRTATEVYAEHVSIGYGTESEFYDLAADPNQLQNGVGSATYAGHAASLQGILDALKTCAGVTCWYDGPAP